MTTAERVADLTRELPEEAQAEVLDFVEFLRAKTLTRGARPAVAGERGTVEQLHSALRDWRATPVDPAEPDWSPLEIEAMDLGPSDDEPT
ncbi:MAG: DUF2281 domain-containing protein [Polyangiales bacterium]